MRYLVKANLSTESYSTNYTLFGIFKTEEGALQFMKAYNNRVKKFERISKELIKKAAYDPMEDPKYQKLLKEGMTKSQREEVYDIFAEADKYHDKLKEAGEEFGLAFYDDGCELELFKFDEDSPSRYIDKFDGSPKCLCSYSE